MSRKGMWLLAVLVAVPVLVGLGIGWAQENEEGYPAPSSGPMTHMLLGRVASVEGDVFVLHEESGETVRFTVTPETMGHRGFKAGDWIIASVLPDGRAAAITALLDREAGTDLQTIVTSPSEAS